jgi:hypothetical protein
MMDQKVAKNVKWRLISTLYLLLFRTIKEVHPIRLPCNEDVIEDYEANEERK